MNENNGHLADLALSTSGFVFDPFSGATFTVNSSGLTLLRGLQQGCSRQELVGLLREEFAVGDDTDLQRDLDEFVQMLKHQQLLPGDFNFEGAAT